ncbi:MAG: type I polyketide synthase [Polyangiaceae bacterium]|nr:type I polyketide synthase [Polyangiaceae bacterium]
MTRDAETQEKGAAQTPLQRAVAALAKMKARLDAVEHAAIEPIAIIGIGCRFPAGSTEPNSFFRALESGLDGVRKIPSERWPEGAVPGGAPETRWAGLLDNVEDFDAAFFGISPREAESLDPQQRLLLEVAWETLENAGIPPSQLEGSTTGVFVGLTSLDYRERVMGLKSGHYDAYATTGTLAATAAGRISFTLGLEGPALVTDTACSSSLVSLHLACQSLRARESNLVLAGGVNLLLSPNGMSMAAATTALSPDGRCRTLDAQANGFVRGEGCGLCALKRLSDAVRDGDRILAVILGSAVNQDGRSSGLTAPNVLAQQRLLERALSAAGIQAADLDYIEMHGTGTALGDPIEYEALKAVYGPPRADGSKCLLGSVKTNLGHLESAAGIAGVIKVVLSLKNNLIPKNLHFRVLNPRVSLHGTSFDVARDNHPWPSSSTKTRRAGISSFGISGTNAHVIVQEPPQQPPSKTVHQTRPVLVPLSARSKSSQEAFEKALAEHLTGLDSPLTDIGYTLARRREHHRFRSAVIAQNTHELQAALSGTSTDVVLSVARGESPLSGQPKLVMVFPGQGSQWLGMGRVLYESEAAFREELDAIENACVREANLSVRAALLDSRTEVDLMGIGVIQPVLFAVECAIAAVWKSWGVVPDAVVGHSMGEVAAAYVAGILSLADAVKIICRRSRLLQRKSGQGAMALVELTQEQAQEALRGHEAHLSVAVCNGPRSTVISGDPKHLDEVLASLQEAGIFCRKIKVDVASHSPQMDELTGDLLSELSGLSPKPATRQMLSTVSAKWVRGSELDEDYWIQNLRKPVLFADAIAEVASSEGTIFLEVSPHPILLPAIQDTLRECGREGNAFGSLKRQEDEFMTMQATLAELYVRGRAVNWAALYPTGNLADLPTYQWDRERHFLPFSEKSPKSLSSSRTGHPLTGAMVQPADRSDVRYWEQSVDISTQALEYLGDHVVRGAVFFPAAAYLEMGLAAADALAGAGPVILENVQLQEAIVLERGVPRHLQLIGHVESSTSASLTIVSRLNGESWTRHCQMLCRLAEEDDPAWQDIASIEARCPRQVDAATHYALLAARDLNFGPAFRGLVSAAIGSGEVLGKVCLPPAAGSAKDYRVHPALLDACLQVAAHLLDGGNDGQTWLPVAIEEFGCFDTLEEECWVHACIRESRQTPEFRSVDLTIADGEGRATAVVKGMWLQQVAKGANADPFADCIYQTAWEEKSPPLTERSAGDGGTWIVFSDAGGVGSQLATRLRMLGMRCVEVEIGVDLISKSRDIFVIDPRSRDHMQVVLDAVFDSTHSRLRGVVHLWNLNVGSTMDNNVEGIQSDLTQGVLSALHLIQGLVEIQDRNPPRVVLVTQGGQGVESNDRFASALQGCAWGFARVLSMEHPEFSCLRVDLESRDLGRNVSDLLGELLNDDGEDQVAFRGGKRYVARLRHQTLPADCSAHFDSESTYVVTGGLTGLGLEVAQFLVARGARSLLLIGRRSPSPDAATTIRQMEQAGVHVQVGNVDVANSAELSIVLAATRKRGLPIRGIFHCAAVLEDHPISGLSDDSFWPPFRPKVLGTWNLHIQTQHDPLDYFVMFSSAAALLGSPGQANYAAANTFMDTLALERRANQLPATSIQWGPFSEVGLAAVSANRGQRLALRGIHSFSPREGLMLMERAISTPVAVVGLVRLSLRQLFDFYPRMVAAPFFAAVRSDGGTNGPREVGRAEFRTGLEKARAKDRRRMLESHLVDHLEKVLRLPAGRIDLEGPFLNYGMDSLMSLEVRHRLEASLGIKLSAAVLYTYPNVSSLAGHLLEILQLSEVDSVMPPEREQSDPQIWEELSVDTAAAMLDEKLLDLEDYLNEPE